MNNEWETIWEDYKKARFVLWCPKHCNDWWRDEETGYYYMWKAYYTAKNAETKENLVYARVLAMMASELSFKIHDYERLHKYIEPALKYYRLAENSEHKPSHKEVEIVQRDYDYLTYRFACEDMPYDEQVKLIDGYEKLSKFGFHDSKVIFFEHNENTARMKLQYDSMIVTFIFNDVWDIKIDTDIGITWINDFYCYRQFWDRNKFVFDIGFYKIYCSRIAVESIEIVSNDEQ